MQKERKRKRPYPTEQTAVLEHQNPLIDVSELRINCLRVENYETLGPVGRQITQFSSTRIHSNPNPGKQREGEKEKYESGIFFPSLPSLLLSPADANMCELSPRAEFIPNYTYTYYSRSDPTFHHCPDLKSTDARILCTLETSISGFCACNCSVREWKKRIYSGQRRRKTPGEKGIDF